MSELRHSGRKRRGGTRSSASAAGAEQSGIAGADADDAGDADADDAGDAGDAALGADDDA